jgi:hypothetical protein
MTSRHILTLGIMTFGQHAGFFELIIVAVVFFVMIITVIVPVVIVGIPVIIIYA